MNSAILNTGDIKFADALNRIKKKHDLNKVEMNELNKIKGDTIKGLAFTTDGGFCEKGNFYRNIQEGLGTIRVKYQSKDNSEHFLILNKIKDNTKENDQISLDIRVKALYQKIEDAACFYKQAGSEAKKIYFQNLFHKLCFHKKAYVSGLRSQFQLPNYSPKVNGLKCIELSHKGKDYIIDRGLQVQTELELAYRDVIESLSTRTERSILESHLNYVIQDKAQFSILKTNAFL